MGETPFNQWDRDKHKLVSVSLVNWLQREYPGRKLLVYYHLKHKTFTIFEWKNKMRGWFHEYLVIGKSLGDFDRDKAKILKEILFYSPEEERQRLIEHVRTTAATTRLGDVDDAEEHRDSYRYVKRHSRNKAIRSHPRVAAFAEG